MLDAKLFEEHFSEIKSKLIQRNADPSVLDETLILLKSRRESIQKVETLKSNRNSVSKEIGILKGKSKSDPEAGKLADEKVIAMRAIGDEITNLEKDQTAVQEKLDRILYTIPNLAHESVPVGKDEHANREVRKKGVPTTLSFKPKDHVEIAEGLGIVDFERAIKLAGARFSLYLGAGARLERALIQFMLDLHTHEHGYREVIPPFMVNRETMTGTGQLPKFEDDLFKIKQGEHEYFLIPTSEVPLTCIYYNEILDAKQLPVLLTAYSPCFRSEAGSYGKDTRGLIRLHQFQKVELVKLAAPESSFEELEKMTANAEKVLELLELPYRVVELCTGDMGFSATKTYDLEVWLPSQGKYREISSCSNCGDFQARRAKIRFKRDAQGKAEFVHTLNGSGLAVGRTFVAILENFQDASGNVKIPKALHRYLEGAPGFTRKGSELWIQK